MIPFFVLSVSYNVTMLMRLFVDLFVGSINGFVFRSGEGSNLARGCIWQHAAIHIVSAHHFVVLFLSHEGEDELEDVA